MPGGEAGREAHDALSPPDAGRRPPSSAVMTASQSIHAIGVPSLMQAAVSTWRVKSSRCAMREFTESHRDWLTVVQLPAYAPDLNPAEGAWANMKNGLGNLAASSVDQLAAIVRNRLKCIQYRPQLMDGFLAQTGLTLEPRPP